MSGPMFDRTVDEALTMAWRGLRAGCIAVSSHLSEPYPDDERWTPWTRFVQPPLSRMDDAIAAVRGEVERLRGIVQGHISWPDRREGMVVAYGYDGRYVGCTGRETWQWLIDHSEVGARELDGLLADVVRLREERDAWKVEAEYHSAQGRELSSRVRELEDGLRRIAAQQPATLGTLRANGVVFDGPLGRDPRNWEHVAFSIYTDLCEVDGTARALLDGKGSGT